MLGLNYRSSGIISYYVNTMIETELCDAGVQLPQLLAGRLIFIGLFFFFFLLMS